jgi:hypothetical protein
LNKFPRLSLYGWLLVVVLGSCFGFLAAALTLLSFRIRL